MLRSFLVAALAATLGIAPVLAHAQPKPGEPAKADAPKKEEKDPKTVDYERAVKDLKRIDGPFPMYIRRKEILLELSEENLGKPFLIQATLGSGANDQDLQAGAPLNNLDMFTWERADEQVYLQKPNLKYRWSADSPLGLSSERSFPKAMLGSYRIEQTDPARKLLLVNVTNLFQGDVFRLSEMVAAMLSGPYMYDREKSSITRIKGFGDNTVVALKMHFTSPRGGAGGDNPLAALLGLGKNSLEDDRSAPLAVTYNLWYRKDTGYRPRFADPRVGYFTESFYNVDKFFDADQTQRLILRWNLKKKNPGAAMSEPVKPIVWTLDPSIPKKWRPAVREGILRWNKAFEALGYKNAVQVQEVDNDPDYDHADGRYNVVRFPMSEAAGYAVALVRNDPVTGEIMNAAVNFDMTMLSFAMTEQKNLAVPSASALVKRSEQALLRTDDNAALPPDRFVYDFDQVRAEAAQDAVLKKFGWARERCSYGRDLARDAAFAFNAMKAVPGFRMSPDAYVNQFITDVVSHEVGHCFGLRHNFVSSTNLTTAQLADDSLTANQGIAASVMDYTPANIQAVLKGGGNVYAPTIGAYDVWAIKYGYIDLPASSPLGEVWALSRIASACNEPGHAYLSDEDADDYDPYAVRFDCAKDPIAYSGKNMVAAQHLLNYALTQLPKAGESYTTRTEAIVMALSHLFREGRMSARFVGGLATNRNFKGDLGERPTLAPVSASDQRLALQLITGKLLTANAFKLPSEAYLKMNLGPEENTWTAPIRSMISSQQIALASVLLSANKTSAIAENSFKTGEGSNSYTLSEHYGTILGAVFSEVGANQNVPSLRRDLQRFVLNGLISQAGAPSGSVNEDVRLIASDSIARIAVRINRQLANASKLDDLTRMHLRDMKAGIDRFRNRSISTPR